MTKHERLKVILDKIGYRDYNDGVLFYDDNSNLFMIFDGDGGYEYVSIRQIIFTQSFMEKLAEYISKKGYKPKHRKYLSSELNIKAFIDYNNPIKWIEELLSDLD